METQTQKGAVEAIIFASGEPIPLDKIAVALELSKDETEALVTSVMEAFNQTHSGIQIIRLKDSYQMCTKAEFEPKIRLALELKNNTPLSAAALEVLAIVAYHQPVTKAFLEQVRGVDSSGVLNGLFAKGLVEERGRLELPGRPLLYGTTQNFLRCMGISSLEELPHVPDPKDTAGKADGKGADDTADDKQLKLENI